jgi:AAA15 family ATPase/GTPase
VLTLEDCKDITVLTGLNDVGKSNVLKALNLFFNRQTDWHAEHNFATDYSVIRREAVKKSIREQQFISISIQFIRGNVLTNSLPPMFTVTRRWDLSTSKGDYKQYNADVYTQMKAYCKKNSFEYSETRTNTYLSRFLNRIEYIYIPAIKDQSVFNTILHMLQTSLLADNKNKTLYQPINAANKALEGELHDLQDDFKVSTGITSKIEIPESFNLKQDMLGVFR